MKLYFVVEPGPTGFPGKTIEEILQYKLNWKDVFSSVAKCRSSIGQQAKHEYRGKKEDYKIYSVDLGEILEIK